MILFSARTTNGTSSTFQVWDYSQNKVYKPFTLLISGTMNGATITMNVSNDGTTWTPAYQTASTGGALFESTARYVQAVITGAGASTSITIELT